MSTYICCDCKIEKPFSDFHKNNAKTIGIKYHCKECNYKRIKKINYPPKIDGNKNCRKCGISKPITEFFARPSLKDGRDTSCKKCKHERRMEHLHTDINFRLKEVCRGRVRDALDGKTKSIKTMELIGCTVDELKIHLESKFTEGMTWDNYGFDGWHIDHRIPCAKFDLSKEDEQRKCFHYTNLQPLWAKDNLRKGSKIL